MAREQIKTVVKLGFDNGMQDGKTQIRYQSFSNIKRTATDSKIVEFTSAINNLSEKEVIYVFNIMEDEIIVQKGVEYENNKTTSTNI